MEHVDHALGRETIVDDSGVDFFLDDDDYDDEMDLTEFAVRKTNRERSRRRPMKPSKDRNPEREHQKTRRRDVDEDFRCRHCRIMVGPVPSGGSHRNHCPNCLYSLHVDGKTSGDRASDCHSLMAPVGLFTRISGEEVIVHRCLGCGFERFNRVAADDNPLVVMGLPPVDPPYEERETRRPLVVLTERPWIDRSKGFFNASDSR